MPIMMAMYTVQNTTGLNATKIRNLNIALLRKLMPIHANHTWEQLAALEGREFKAGRQEL